MKATKVLQISNNLLWIILIGVVLGFFLGVLVLFPANEFINYFEYYIDTDFNNVWDFLRKRLSEVFQNKHPIKVRFFGLLGSIVLTSILVFFRLVLKKIVHIEKLQKEIDENIEIIISKGESSTLEFKSSFRWDLQKDCVNKALEKVIIKTITGFLNSKGGTLLIGVNDNGEVLGLENDYKTIKRRDQDGYEQMIIGSVSSNIGADQCKNVEVLFHDVDGKDVCRMVINPSDKPVYVDSGNNTKFYLRTGGGTRELNVHEAIDYVASRWS